MDLPHWNSCIGLWTFRVYTRSTFRRLTPPDQDVLPLLTCAASEDAAAAAVTCISHRSSCAPQARAPRAPATADASGASVQLSLLHGDGALEADIGASTHDGAVGCRVLYVRI